MCTVVIYSCKYLHFWVLRPRYYTLTDAEEWENEHVLQWSEIKDVSLGAREMQDLASLKPSHFCQDYRQNYWIKENTLDNKRHPPYSFLLPGGWIAPVDGLPAFHDEVKKLAVTTTVMINDPTGSDSNQNVVSGVQLDYTSLPVAWHWQGIYLLLPKASTCVLLEASFHESKGETRMSHDY